MEELLCVVVEIMSFFIFFTCINSRIFCVVFFTATGCSRAPVDRVTVPRPTNTAALGVPGKKKGRRSQNSASVESWSPGCGK